MLCKTLSNTLSNTLEGVWYIFFPHAFAYYVLKPFWGMSSFSTLHMLCNKFDLCLSLFRNYHTQDKYILYELLKVLDEEHIRSQQIFLSDLAYIQRDFTLAKMCIDKKFDFSFGLFDMACKANNEFLVIEILTQLDVPVKYHTLIKEWTSRYTNLDVSFLLNPFTHYDFVHAEKEFYTHASHVNRES